MRSDDSSNGTRSGVGRSRTSLPWCQEKVSFLPRPGCLADRCPLQPPVPFEQLRTQWMVKVNRRQTMFETQGFVDNNMVYHGRIIGVVLPANPQAEKAAH